MARRFRTQGFRKRSPNRSWAGIVDTSNNIAGGSTKVLLGTLGLSNVNIDETVLRTVGLISVNTDQEIATERQEGAFGIVTITQRAATAGAASIPGPIDDIGNDEWIVHVPFINTNRLLTGVGADFQASTQRYFDFKTKRITEDGETLAFMVQSTANSAGFNFSVILRLLSLLVNSECLLTLYLEPCSTTLKSLKS